jgi:hypothetical protein
MKRMTENMQMKLKEAMNLKEAYQNSFREEVTETVTRQSFL